MDVYKLVSLIAIAICLAMLLFQLLRLISAGNPVDYSKPSGSIRDGVIYSFTSAMSPFEKESAFMHLPTYVAGIIFHIGTFLSFPVLLTLIIYPKAFIESALLSSLGGVVFSAGAISGLAILIKRIVKKELRSISGADDYISNAVTTVAQALSAFVLLTGGGYPLYYIAFSIFLIWIPIGKTRHLLYFFYARYHLGAFYGRRGTWPVNRNINE